MTAPSSRSWVQAQGHGGVVKPDTTAQEHADVVRKGLRLGLGKGVLASCEAALDALLAHVERLTAERDEARWGSVEHREGMMEVYDWTGRYAGCIGSETWTRLVMEAKAGAA